MAAETRAARTLAASLAHRARPAHPGPSDRFERSWGQFGSTILESPMIKKLYAPGLSRPPSLSQFDANCGPVWLLRPISSPILLSRRALPPTPTTAVLLPAVTALLLDQGHDFGRLIATTL